MQARVFEEASKNPNNTTRPGGAFVVDGRWVDANGMPLSSSDVKDHVEAKQAEGASAADLKAYEEDKPTIMNEPTGATPAEVQQAINAEMTKAQAKAEAKADKDEA
jgi:hypothetical protein